MKLITNFLFLFLVLCTLSCCDDKLNIECPCLDDNELPPYYKSCEELGESDDRYRCMVNTMLQNLYSQLEYPEKAREAGVEGTVVVAIIIDSEGAVIKTETRNDPLLGHGLEESALKAVNLLNDNWCPGLKMCEPVNSEFVLPVKYKLAN